ncbi:hypothetical protein [Bdellovibrio bacteriovorus]|uniref:Uncharacterized protein n=1 Tax=Bdellovibrio bacteriovorus TaxID=959 RepID=A0A1Z3N4X5_BDEBC|nr:hypothetical protein [Bdellovibrio bacteriovorus]ASD62530.1 hypothetical protein B9G79_02575 [Bdellovibrio bacteriovorus]
MSRETKKYLPYILATLLLVGLIVMVQTQKPLKARTSGASFAQQAGYFFLPPGSAKVSDVTEAQYRALLTDFQVKYIMPVFNSTGRPLLIPAEWENPYFAAFAQNKDTYMQVSLWGGMARAPGASLPVLAGILCHEIGHVIAGEPRQTFTGAEWSSSEGQSDFYAAKDCLPQFLKAHPELVADINPQVLALCGGNELCARVAQTGVEMVQFFKRYDSQKSDDVSLWTPAPAAEQLLRNVYPSHQCRLDTYLAGALCQTGGSCSAPACWTANNQE